MCRNDAALAVWEILASYLYRGRVSLEWLSFDEQAAHGRYPALVDHDELARCFVLSSNDLDRAWQKREPWARLGWALQLGTVRYLGAFQSDPTDVPVPVVDFVAGQVGVRDPSCLKQYRDAAVRWRHTGEIRQVYGYVDFMRQPEQSRFERWLYQQAWTTGDGPLALFRRSVRYLQNTKVLLPGATVLARVVSAVRERATRQLRRKIIAAAPAEVLPRLLALFEAPEGARRSGYDRLRRAPTNASIGGLVAALDRLAEVIALGAGSIDLSHLPAGRIGDIARYANGAWIQQIANLGEERKAATLIVFAVALTASALDDVVDVLDVVLGDLQINVRTAGQRRRLDDLPVYNAAVADLQASIRRLYAVHDADGNRADAFTVERSKVDTAMTTIDTHMRPTDDNFLDLLMDRYSAVRRFVPKLLALVEFSGTEAAQPVLDSYRYLRQVEITSDPKRSRLPIDDVPAAVVTTAWHPHVFDRSDGTLSRRAYTFYVLEALRGHLRRRDIYLAGSLRWGDPRAELLSGDAWEDVRHSAIEQLGRHTDPHAELAVLTQALDDAWRRCAANLPANPHLRIETGPDGRDRVVPEPLDANTEPPEAKWLEDQIKARMPEVELPELILDVVAMTGCDEALTHVADPEASLPGLRTSICAGLVMEACNLTFRQVCQPDVPALTRARVSHVLANYFRNATLADMNTKIFDFHAALPTTAVWGSGEVASVDGMRLVVPVRTINAGFNKHYFGRERGGTLFAWVSDTHGSFAQRFLPGTPRDSLIALDGILENDTSVDPKTLMTDSAAATDLMFGLCWLCGVHYAPRFKDIGDQRFWTIDPDPDYGPLTGLARNRLRPEIIAENWDDLLRIAVSLKHRKVSASALMRTFQRGPNPSSVARAIAALGRILKAIHLLTYCDDIDYRRGIQVQLNRGENRHSLAREVFHGKRGQLRKRYREGQEDQLDCLGIVINMIAVFNTVYIAAIVNQLRTEGHDLPEHVVARVSPLGHAHINTRGTFHVPSEPPSNTLRPLRDPTDTLSDLK